MAAKLRYDWIIRHEGLAFNSASPWVRLARVSCTYRSQGCLHEAAALGQIMLDIPWRHSCTNEISSKEHGGHPPEEQVMTKGQSTDRGSWQKIKGALPTASIQWQCGKNIGVAGFVFNTWMIPPAPEVWAGVIVLIHLILKMTLS